MPSNKSLHPVLFGFLAALLCLVPWPTDSEVLQLCLIGFAGIAGFSTYFLLKDKRPFAIEQIFWIFLLVFFAWVPSFQLRYGAFPWDIPVVLRYILKANFLIILSMILVVLLKNLQRQFGSMPPKMSAKIGINNKRFTTFGLVLFLSCAAVLIGIYGIENLWVRSASERVAKTYDQPLFLLATSLCRAYMILYFFLGLLLFRKGILKASLLFFLAAIMLVTHFPLVLNRAYLGILYGGSLLLLLPGFFKHAHRFAGLLLITLLLAFPLLNLLRFPSDKMQAMLAHPAQIVKASYIGGDYDAYANFTHTIHAVDIWGSTQGAQLGSAVLFFVPRSMWPSKSVGSGNYVYALFHSWYANVSSPLLAEGYVNFGWLGTLVFCLLFAVLFLVADGYAARVQYFSNAALLSQKSVGYVVLLLFSLFVMRGDLMTSIATLSSFIVAYALLKWLLNREKLSA